jgi:hypothetical protein
VLLSGACVDRMRGYEELCALLGVASDTSSRSNRADSSMGMSAMRVGMKHSPRVRMCCLASPVCCTEPLPRMNCGRRTKAVLVAHRTAETRDEGRLSSEVAW